MSKRYSQKVYMFMIGILIAIAICCRPIARRIDNEFVDKLLNFIRTFIYLGLFATWGISARRRVIQVEVRRWLLAVSVLMVSWIAVREFKWRFVMRPDLIRYLWYSYYIPILMIPLFALFVAMSLGRSADYRLPKWTELFWVPTLFMICTVLSNDLHQAVFRFPEAAVAWTEQEYTYGPLFWAAFGWGMLCAVSSFGIMIVRARIPKTGKRLWLPVLPVALAVCQILLSVARVPVISQLGSDLAVFDCLVYTAFFECCIACGLIQSNTRYGDLFRAAGDISMQIVDEDYIVRYAADSADTIPQGVMEAAEKEPVMWRGGRRVHSMQINGGHAVWAEDLSEILALREQLQDRQEELTERNALLHLEYEREKEHRIIEEQNRLYDLLQNETQEQIDHIQRLATNYRSAETDDDRRYILAHILILGCFVKRRKDFVLSMYEEPNVTEGKLTSAFAESFRALKAYGIQGGFLIRTGTEHIPGRIAVRIYDFFEDVAESILDQGRYLNARILPVDGALRVSILTDGIVAEKCASVKERYPDAWIVDEEDGTEFILWPEGRGGI